MSIGRVLLTGATGLIGRQASVALGALGYEVVSLSRGGEGLTGDLLVDPQGIAERAGADNLLHLAWHDGPERWSSLANLDWINASLTLLRAFARSGGKRAVMVGSCAEYDWSGDGPLRENTALRPATLYGAAKAATGIAAMAAARELGLSLAWARPFFCYGPGEPVGRLFGDIITGLRAGNAVDCTDGLQKRDFLHTADLADALASVLRSDIEGPVNIGSGKAVAVRTLVDELAQALGRPDLINYGARQRPANDPEVIVADVARLRDEVGFSPRFGIREGVGNVLEGGGASR
ncbi:MAG: NAD(P)-dependent oxidoreductase [Rhodobacteraceae bacterium]|nr:NAD(P)-dependent oxidoreductase [Paracoccaceae bacterium]